MKTERSCVVKVKFKQILEVRRNEERDIHASIASSYMSVDTCRADICVGQLAH